MTRRLILVTCALGVLAGTAGAALADTTSPLPVQHEVCVVLAKDANHNHTEDYCINWS